MNELLTSPLIFHQPAVIYHCGPFAFKHWSSKGSTWSIWKELSLTLLCLALLRSQSLSFTLDLSPGYSKLIMPALCLFTGMQKENCIEVLNELGGHYWPQHQLTQLLIMALIRAAEDKRPCNPEYKCPAETCRCTRARRCAHTLFFFLMRKDMCSFEESPIPHPASLLIYLPLPFFIVNLRPVCPS